MCVVGEGDKWWGLGVFLVPQLAGTRIPFLISISSSPFFQSTVKERKRSRKVKVNRQIDVLVTNYTLVA